MTDATLTARATPTSGPGIAHAGLRSASSASIECWPDWLPTSCNIDGPRWGYYAKACAGGDRYACRAGEVATNTGDGIRGVLSEVTNRKLALSIASISRPTAR